MKVEHTTLLRALDVARPAQLQVEVGDLEAVVGAHHRVEAFASFGAQLVFGHEDAVRLAAAPAHAAAQLVELRQPEAFRVLDDHHGGVGDVDAHFDDGGGEQDLRLVLGKPLHLEILVFRLHLAMHHPDAVPGWGKGARHGLVAGHQVQQVRLFRLLDEGIHHEDLPSFVDFPLHEAEQLEAIFLVQMFGYDGLSALWQLVDDGDVEVAVERHGQGARDGCGGHHQHMRWHDVFAPQLGTLLHPETVLLVDDGQTEVLEHDVVFDEGVCAHENIDVAALQPLQNLPPLGGLGGARQEFHPHAQRGQLATDLLEMLGGQDFRGGHQAALEVVVFGDEHGEEGNDGFSAAHVALQQPVHLPSAAHVAPDLAYDPLLGVGQLKVEMLFVEGVEIVPHGVEPVAGDALGVDLFQQKHLQLQEEELVELEAQHGARQFLAVFGVVDVAQRLVQ